MSEKEKNKVELTKDLSNAVDKLLSNVDLSDVSANSNDFESLPEGYYLCEVEKANLTTSKSSGQPMVAFTFKITENGHTLAVNENGDATMVDVSHSKNRKIFVYYPLKNEASLKRFVKDMLKFEGEKEGEPILTKEYFVTSELLCDALDVLTGMRIYVQVSVTINKDETKSTWQNLISWERAKKLELPL